jgi:hypothetical protein
MPRVLSPSQRRKLARNMKVRKLRIKRRKDIVEKKPPSKERVARLAARKALKVLKKRFASSRGEHYKDLSVSGKVAVDTIMANKLTKNKRIAQSIAKRMMPKVRAELMKRRANKLKSMNESFYAGIPDTVYASDLPEMKTQGAFAYHPSVLEDEELPEEHGAGEYGTDKLRKKYQKDTPGQSVKKYE